MRNTTKEEKAWLEKFHIKVKARIEELDITHQHVAQITGMPRSTIYYLTHGTHIPSVTHVVRLARALAMKPSELIDFDIA